MSFKNRIILSLPLIFFPIYIILLTNYFIYLVNIINLLIFIELFYNIYNNKNINNYLYILLNIIPFINLLYFSNILYLNSYYSKILLLKFLTINFGSDASQYVCGKYINIKYLDFKPFKSISPNKTFIGYFFGSLIIYLINLIFINLKYCFIVIVLSIIGDLFASNLKRFLKIKDFSNMLQSHGGFIDRFDSLIFNLPFFYLFILK